MAAPHCSTRNRFLNIYYPATQYELPANLTTLIHELTLYEAAVSDPTYGEQLEQAVQEELQSLASRCTQELIPIANLHVKNSLLAVARFSR